MKKSVIVFIVLIFLPYLSFAEDAVVKMSNQDEITPEEVRKFGFKNIPINLFPILLFPFLNSL